MHLWAERASNPGEIEYVLAWEREDRATTNHFDATIPGMDVPWIGGSVMAIRGDFGGSAPAWDAAYQVSMGALLVQVSDDFFPVEHWDIALLGRLPTGWENEPHVIAINDGLRRDRLMCHAICTRAYADLRGEFLHAGYQSMFSDNEFTARAYIGAANGECNVIEARDLLFKHDHHCARGEPPDATYEWTNRPEAYAAGLKLFNERNPHAYGRDVHLWL
jgi:hypothetical protein